MARSAYPTRRGEQGAIAMAVVIVIVIAIVSERRLEGVRATWPCDCRGWLHTTCRCASGRSVHCRRNHHSPQRVGVPHSNAQFRRAVVVHAAATAAPRLPRFCSSVSSAKFHSVRGSDLTNSKFREQRWPDSLDSSPSPQIFARRCWFGAIWVPRARRIRTKMRAVHWVCCGQPAEGACVRERMKSRGFSDEQRAHAHTHQSNPASAIFFVALAFVAS